VLGGNPVEIQTVIKTVLKGLHLALALVQVLALVQEQVLLLALVQMQLLLQMLDSSS
jgi:hypothetical protein